MKGSICIPELIEHVVKKRICLEEQGMKKPVTSIMTH